MELNQELEKEQNLDYYYNEEEEEEVEGEEKEKEKEKEEEKGSEENEQKDKQKNEKEGNSKINDNKEEDKIVEKEKEKENNNKIENEKNIDNINNEIKDNKENKGKNKDNIINEINKNENENENENKINEEEQKETSQNQNTENSESARQQIIEEIDTTIPKKNNNGENAPKEGDIIIQSFSPNTICHRIIPKGSDLDISKKAHFKCYKIKTKSNIMSFITGTKKIVAPYIIFFDENYYYMAKDKIINQKNQNLRRIGNKYDLLKLSNFQTTKKGEDYEFAFEFVNEDIFDRTFKLLYFTQKEAEDFYSVLHTILEGFNIEIPENLEGDEEEEEEEDDDDEEEGEEIEDNEDNGEEKEGKNEIIKVEDKKEEEKEDEKNDDNKDNNNKKNENNEDETKEGTTISTKEENKEIRDIEVISQ